MFFSAFPTIGENKQERETKEFRKQQDSRRTSWISAQQTVLKAGTSSLPSLRLVTLSKPWGSTRGSWMFCAAAPNTTAGWAVNWHTFSLLLPDLRRFHRAGEQPAACSVEQGV